MSERFIVIVLVTSIAVGTCSKHAPKTARSVVELEWTSVLVATSSSETRVNISDMYFNRQKKMNTSKEVFLDPSDLREVLVDRKLSGFRSCFIDAWGRAQYCETNQCNPDLDLLRVHGIRLTLWDTPIMKGTTFWFNPISSIPREWFKESNLKDMDMCCHDCEFSFSLQRMRIVDDVTRRTGVLQVDWRDVPTEFLYVHADRTTPQQMPLSTSNEAVVAAAHLSIDYLLEVPQVLNGSTCPMTAGAASKTSTPKPLVVTEPEELGPLTTDCSDITSDCDSVSVDISDEIITPVTTRTTESVDRNVHIISTTCVTVLPNGTLTNSSFYVNLATYLHNTQNLVETIYSQLVIPKPLLGRYRRRLRCAQDERTSSRVLGVFACASISVIVGVVFLLDLSSWQRQWPILKRNLCNA